MSSKKRAGKSSIGSSSSGKGNNVSEGSSYSADQLGQNISAINLSSADDSQWEVPRKHQNKSTPSVAKPFSTVNPSANAWGHPNMAQKLGMQTNVRQGEYSGNPGSAPRSDSKRETDSWNARPVHVNKGIDNKTPPQTNMVRAPLENGWDWRSRAGSAPQAPTKEYQTNPSSNADDYDDANDEDNGSDATDDSDLDILSDYDSDCSIKSHETRKKSKCFSKFFDTMEPLNNEEIAKPGRQWHCPACQGGPGAIDWYKGLQPLMAHAKTKGGKKMKLHRDFAEILDEELNRRGTSVIPSGTAYSNWNGPGEARDFEILWPPMVMIMNTKLGKDDNDKWLGMGNQELLDYFPDYAAVKSRHSYGPQGHRGMSILIFESSAMGYIEAERLHKHFEDKNTNRDAWDRRRILFYEGGKRQLYGFKATKEDLDFFNQHCQGKMKLKYEMRSHKEMVVDQLNRMKEDNEKLVYLKSKVVKEQRLSKALEKSIGTLSERLHRSEDTNRIVRQRTKMQHDQNKEAMDFQEEFFSDQIKIIHEARDAQEDKFEKLQQEERKKVELCSNSEDQRLRAEEVAQFIKFQNKEMEEFVAEREELMNRHEKNKADMRQRHMKEAVELEKEFDVTLNKLMDKYVPQHQE